MQLASASSALPGATASMASIALNTRCTCSTWRNFLANKTFKLNNMEQNIKQAMPYFELGNLYVFKEEDEDGELTIIGKLIAKNEGKDTLTFGNQYEIETENFVTDQALDLRISTNKELRERQRMKPSCFKRLSLSGKRARSGHHSRHSIRFLCVTLMNINGDQLYSCKHV